MSENNKITLICLPFGGAGASFFNEWSGLSNDVVIESIQLPGREKRFMEPLYTDIHVAAQGVTEDILANDKIDKRRSLALFGHSFGAVLAFEVAQRLRQADYPLNMLIVSGSPDPWHIRSQKATGLDDEGFVAKVAEIAGYQHEAMENEMMRELILPILRADVGMHEGYVAAEGACIDIPIMVLRGEHDTLVSADQTTDWQLATSDKMNYVEREGSHMFFVDDPAKLLAFISQTMSSD